MKKIVCLGDSLTYGEIGAAYIDYLAPDIIPVNKGVNGDTTDGALRRLKRILDGGHFDDAHGYVVEIGVNEVILNGYTFEDDWFEKTYDEILGLLAQTGKQVITVGIPLIEFPGFPLYILQQGSSIIKNLAEKYGFDFVDILMLQWEASGELGEMTIDGCHFNEHSARLLAEGINNFLEEIHK